MRLLKSHLCATVGLLGCLLGCQPEDPQTESLPAGVAIDTPVDSLASQTLAALPSISPSAYKNTTGDVPFVGDARCAECHSEIAASYAAHPMGQSTRDLLADGPQQFDADAANSFRDGRFEYQVNWDGERMVHHEKMLDDAGHVLCQQAFEMEFEVGAGEHGRSYLFRRDETMWMSPITWYPQQNRWALSPNYEIQNAHFTRAIVADCLFCHSNRANHVKHTINRYESPPFGGVSIHCERCHGPGDLHVAKHLTEGTISGMPDDTIVNPQRLDPLRRDSVCEQCHLPGKVRVARRGRHPYEYRPGLLWHEFVTTFSVPTVENVTAEVTGHVDQLRSSGCFSGSNGEMSCISCHDPHVKPAISEKAAYFRQRCLRCHGEDDCLEASEERAATAVTDNCVTCHMPAVTSSVKHAAITDHRIPRKPLLPGKEPKQRAATGAALEFFYHEQIDAEDMENRRDFAVGIMALAATYPEMVDQKDILTALPKLEQAVARDPTDMAAVEALAHAQFRTNRTTSAVKTVEDALLRVPRHETLLGDAALAFLQRREWDKAYDVVSQLIAGNPHYLRYHQMLLQIAIGQRDVELGIQACRQGLEIDPSNKPLRQALVDILRAAGRNDEAAIETDLLQRM